MGCDIHIILEKNISDGGRPSKWVGVLDFGYLPMGSAYRYYPETPEHGRGYLAHRLGSRNYAFFVALAGVRGVGPAPLGVPDDASDLARCAIAGWGGDGHSHSYLPAAQFMLRWCTHKDVEPVKMFELFEAFTGRYLGGDSMDDYRFVFWFDN